MAHERRTPLSVHPVALISFNQGDKTTRLCYLTCNKIVDTFLTIAPWFDVSWVIDYKNLHWENSDALFSRVKLGHGGNETELELFSPLWFDGQRRTFSKNDSVNRGRSSPRNCSFLSGSSVNKIRFVIHEATGKKRERSSEKAFRFSGPTSRFWGFIKCGRFIPPLFRSRRSIANDPSIPSFSLKKSLIFPFQGGNLLSLNFL